MLSLNCFNMSAATGIELKKQMPPRTSLLFTDDSYWVCVCVIKYRDGGWPCVGGGLYVLFHETLVLTGTIVLFSITCFHVKLFEKHPLQLISPSPLYCKYRYIYLIPFYSVNTLSKPAENSLLMARLRLTAEEIRAVLEFDQRTAEQFHLFTVRYFVIRSCGKLGLIQYRVESRWDGAISEVSPHKSWTSVSRNRVRKLSDGRRVARIRGCERR